MRRFVKANLQTEDLKELAEDIVRGGREQAVPDREFVEEFDRPEDALAKRIR